MSHVRTSGWIAFLAVLCVALVGCGDKADDNGAGKPDDNNAEKPNVDDAPKPNTDETPKPSAAKGGADSPQGVIDMAKALSESKDFGGFVNLIVPEERGLLSFAMMMGAQMAPMMMGGFAEMGGEEAKKAMQEKLAAFQKSLKDVFKKHGIPDMEQMAAGGKEPQNPLEAVKMLEEAAPGLDHAAFVGDVIELMGTLGDEAAGQSTSKFEKIAVDLTDLKIEGDTASAKAGDEDLRFKKVDGRWYLTIAHEMGMGMGPGPK